LPKSRDWQRLNPGFRDWENVLDPGIRDPGNGNPSFESC